MHCRQASNHVAGIYTLKPERDPTDTGSDAAHPEDA